MVVEQVNFRETLNSDDTKRLSPYTNLSLKNVSDWLRHYSVKLY
jgi:hypothetical protein